MLTIEKNVKTVKYPSIKRRTNHCLPGISSVGRTQWWRTAATRSQSHTQPALLS